MLNELKISFPAQGNNPAWYLTLSQTMDGKYNIILSSDEFEHDAVLNTFYSQADAFETFSQKVSLAIQCVKDCNIPA